MYLTINNIKNKPILRGKLKGFGTHTAASEKHSISTLMIAFYACLDPDTIEILDEEQLKQFEDMYRLDDKPEHFTNAKTEERHYYVFRQPKLRGDYCYIITDDGYKRSSPPVSKT